MTTKRLASGIEIDVLRHFGEPTMISTFKLGCPGSHTWFTLAELDTFIAELQAARSEAAATRP